MNETCGCCEGLESLTPLATANRPGLDALAYRAGTHPTFLETMEARLSAGDYPALAALTTRAATDPAIALLDAWATVADVLTFYQERIANEGYLRTATERRSILELARLVDYTLRPGVAASVYLAFTLAEGYEVEIPIGTRAQSLPGPGELPQSFETADKLEARTDWNTLQPRLARPSPIDPNDPSTFDTLYFQDVTTNLKPNDPLLLVFGSGANQQRFLRVATVEAQPLQNRTKVTLRMDDATPAPAVVRRAQAVLAKHLDLSRFGVSSTGRTAQEVIGGLEELRTNLVPEISRRSLANLLEQEISSLQGKHEDASRLGYTRLQTWLSSVVRGLREAAEDLLKSRPGAQTGSSSAFFASSINGPAKSEAIDVGKLLEPLQKPPSIPPAGSLRLKRDLKQTFSRESDSVAQLVVSHNPVLKATLYPAWANANVTDPSDLESAQALRVQAAPFGHNAFPKPIHNRQGVVVGNEEWTLAGTNAVSVGVRLFFTRSFEARAASSRLRALLSITRNGETRSEQVPLEQQSPIQVEELGAEIRLDPKNNSIEFRFRDPSRVFTLTPDPRGGPEVKVEISGDRERSLIPNQTLRYSIAQRRISIAYEVDDQTGDISISIVDESLAQAPDRRVLILDARYDQIVPGSWVVIKRPTDSEKERQVIIARVTETETLSITNYGILATQVTQLTLDRDWLSPRDTSLAVLRGTTVFAQGEPLELADEPIDDDVQDDTIELDDLYDGLESGRWLIVSGERTDIPGTSGVTASEVVMLAGITQGVQQVKMIAGRGSTGEGGYDLEISARLLPDGSATGYATLVGGATGHVVQVVAPSGMRDFWCINVKRTDTGPNSGDQRINWYIRDVGDGKTTFDEITCVSGIGVDCTTNPDPSPCSAWIPLTEGDFKARTDLPGDKTHSFLRLAQPLSYRYKRDTAKIYGNVARATHGETRNEVLGSGDGSEALQQFTLKQSPLTYVAATTPTGIESTLKVYVNDIRWHEAKSLTELKSPDRRFVTRTDDQDNTTVIFGDGEHGARLPTGPENVRAVYRTGIGKVGNVAAKQISQLAMRPLGLKDVINPLPATGGADRETRDQARGNVPLAMMALDRLVSVQDYADFARTFAGIGKASATRLSDGRRQLVHLTIAGTNDIPIAEDSDLYRNLVQALLQFGDPHQPIQVNVRELILLIISARVRVLPDYQWESVEPKIRTALLDTFSFESRELGQDALLSEVISTIQRVPGVAYVDVDTFGGVPEKTTDDTTRERHPLLPSEVAEAIQKLVTESERDGPHPRVTVDLAGLQEGAIRPAQLALLTPTVPDTLILTEINA